MSGLIQGYRHEAASHCETGSLRNALRFAGLDLSEPMVFGLGSGPAFYYLFFVKGPATLPMLGIRNPPGGVLKNVTRRLGIELVGREHRSGQAALAEADGLLARNVPVAALVDMFYMQYLPAFMRVHAPFHFILLVGREGDDYWVSDPYAEQLERLHRDDLRAAWQTHARMSKDNYLAHVGALPPTLDLRRASREAILRTCRDVILPRPVRRLAFFIGPQGMRTFARAMRRWPARHRGVALREGILFHVVMFEEQGTGGGAFRLMYAAFLQELSERFGARRLGELAARMGEHGRSWRNTSRKFAALGKKLPMADEAYEGWIREHRAELDQGLAELAGDFLRLADFEERFFPELRAAAAAELR
jgi:hypothetical protein